MASNGGLSCVLCDGGGFFFYFLGQNFGQMKLGILRVGFLVLMVGLVQLGWGQTTILSENIGTTGTGTQAIASTTFQNSSLSFTGSADTRITTPSSGYTGASGSRNVFITSTDGINFQISGISTVCFSNLVLSFGAHKSTIASNMTELILEFSTNGVTYTPISFPAQPTGSGTANWRLISGLSLPASANNASNLRLRWTQTSTTTQFRIDDIRLTGVGTPTTQASSFSASGITDVQMNLAWSRGNGTGILVLAKELAPVDASPVNGTNYTANAAFGSGSEIGTGNFVVYKGTSTGLTVTSLMSGEAYYYSLYEFNSTTNCYLTPPLTGSASVLPIELVFFNTEKRQATTYLTWATATELNNDFFQIERSPDGRDFEAIGEVDGAGTSYETLHYAFTDEKPLSGWNYYRLKQVDFDGQFAYSPVRAVLMGKATANFDQLRLFPNPAANEIFIQSPANIQPGDLLEIFDQFGRLVLQREAVEALDGPLDLFLLPAGLYVARLQTEDGAATGTFLVKR